MGNSGTKFVYEMDVVMGGLLGIPFYSKFEGVLMLAAAIGCLHILGPSPNKELYIVLGLVISGTYMLVCVAYAMYARQPVKHFVIIAVVIWLVEAWRLFWYVHFVDYLIVSIVFVIAIALVFVANWRMRARLSDKEEVIDRFVRIQQYCEENPNYTWTSGQDSPDGFEYVGAEN